VQCPALSDSAALAVLMNDGGDDFLRIQYGTLVPVPDGQGDKHHLPFIELAERRQRRGRRAHLFQQRQRLIAFDRRPWVSITDMADAHACKSGTFDADDRIRGQFIEAVRRSILSGEFSDGKSSKVLNLHPSGLAQSWWFEVLGASNPEQFDPIASHLWIGRKWWINWFDRGGIKMPTIGRAVFKVLAVPTGQEPQASPLDQPAARRAKASDGQIRTAIHAAIKPFIDRGDVAPNVNDGPPLVQSRLKEQNLHASIRDIQGIYEEDKFKALRGHPGVRKDYRKK
jgi:hypothetical protein